MLPNLFTPIHFTHPFVLWLLPLSLLILTLGLRLITRHLQSWSALYASQQQQHYRHPLASLLIRLHEQTQGKSSPELFRKWLAYAVLLGLLQLSLAQPYRLGEKLPTPPQYRDIVFLVDTSVSMMLRDYLVKGRRADRMSMVKSVLGQFIDSLAGSRLGLVIFSEHAYTLVPLTTDHALLKYQLQRLTPASLTGRRTDPGKALLYVLNDLAPRLREGEKPVLVMMTDANRPVRDIDPRTAAALVKQKGLHLQVIAMGAASQAAKENAPSGLIYQTTNITLLKSMAHAGGGDFFQADSQDSLKRILAKVQASEQQPVRLAAVFIKIPLYYWPLSLALLWILLGQILPFFRRHP